MNKKSQRPTSKTLSKSTKNKRVHNTVHNIEVCSKLQQIINAWPKLSDDKKKQILEIIAER